MSQLQEEKAQLQEELVVLRERLALHDSDQQATATQLQNQVPGEVEAGRAYHCPLVVLVTGQGSATSVVRGESWDLLCQPVNTLEEAGQPGGLLQSSLLREQCVTVHRCLGPSKLSVAACPLLRGGPSGGSLLALCLPLTPLPVAFLFVGLHVASCVPCCPPALLRQLWESV